MIVRRNIIYRLFLWTLIFMSMSLLSSCIMTENFEYPSEIGEGTSDVRFDIEFRPLESVDPSTRTAGDAVKHIESVCVVVYKTDGDLYGKYPIGNITTSEEDTADISLTPPDGSSGFAESTYCSASFSLQLPLGEYRIYAVANYIPTDEQIATEEALKSISFDWNSTIAENNAMFGYFTNGNVSVPSYDSDTAEGRFEAPVLRIDKNNVTLHAWVRRLVSKVTVGFDGSELNENVYIYIHSVQIKDIPSEAYLGKDNKPSSGLIANGETIWYRSSSSAVKTAGLRVTKGVPGGISMEGTLAEGTQPDNSDNQGGIHHETANSLFLFENLQGNTATIKGKWQDSGNSFDSEGNITGTQDGVIDHPDGGTSGTIDFKDGVSNGSYIEVKAYYVNKTSTNASQGEIVYRFMLGKDTERNCDVERSNHFKVVLKFIKDANNIDWHIDYEPENPGISVPSPMYISYLHGEKLDIPVVVRGGAVVSFNAEIIDNDWYYEGHHRIATTNDVDFNGFLSMVEPSENNDIDMGYDERETDYLKGQSTLSATSEIKPFKTEELTDGIRYIVPVYTRSVSLGQGFSGNNAYIHKERTADVKFTVVVQRADGSKDTITETIKVIQVKRVVNPTGVWRPCDSDKKFNVVLMESDEVSSATYATPDQAISFRPTVSDGPWAAEIIQGADWVRISKTDGNYGTDLITGSTGTHVDFYYKPVGTCASNVTRCGVIRITYHNNTCIHYVFVTQGLAPVQMAASRTKWHLTNVHRKNVEEATPLHEGSMFRYLNTNTAIMAENNYRPDTKSGYGYGPFKPISDYTNNDDYDSGAYWVKEGTSDVIQEREWPLTNDNDSDLINGYVNVGGRESEYSLRVNYNKTPYNNIDYSDVFPDIMSNAKVASCAQWVELEDLERYYGVMYGNETTETKTSADDAYEFPFVGVDGSHTSYSSVPYDYDKGMRGMFVWDRENLSGRSGGGGHVFFPIGATGHGHRMHYPDWNRSTNAAIQPYQKIGELKYATMSEPLTGDTRPLLYDLYLSPGAIYWCRDWTGNANGSDGEPGSANDGVDFVQDGQNAQDINYHTYDFNTYSEYATWRTYWNGTSRYRQSLTQSSDACFIRCVEP